MNNTKIESIRKELVVDVSREIAFKVFTENMDLWWPRTHHIGKSPMTLFVLEPRLNGRWYSCHEGGSEQDVGYVLTWNPHELLVLAWQIDGNFKFDSTLITEVEVLFIAEAPERTRIKFEHKNLERLGGGKAVESMDEGWGKILDLYKNQTK
jgi:uncharacterized protein YndB with AHSA1/START domain